MPLVPSPSQRSSSSWIRATLALALSVGLAGCRQEQVTRYRIPKEAPPKPAAPSDHPPHPGHENEGHEGHNHEGEGHEGHNHEGEAHKPTAAAKLKWTLPKGWKEGPGDSPFVVAALMPPVSGDVKASVAKAKGGPALERANVDRWRGQIQLPPVTDDELAKGRKLIKTPYGKAILYDFTGKDAKKRLVVAAFTVSEEDAWFVKLTGDAALVAKAYPEFMKLIESVHLD